MKGFTLFPARANSAGLVRAAWPVRTSPGPFRALRTPTRRVEVKSKSKTAGCPHPRSPQLSFWTTTANTARLEGGEGAGPGGGGARGGDKEAGQGVGKCSSANPTSVATQALLVKWGLQLSGVCGPDKGNPCAVGASAYPISGGEGDVTCELVTYERLWRKLFNRIPLYPERRAAFPACRGCSGKGDVPPRSPHSFIKWHRAVAWGWVRFFGPALVSRRAFQLPPGSLQTSG